MATTEVEMRVNLYKNGNRKSDYYGHFYPYLDRTGTLNTRGLCKHMSSHNSVFGREVIEGVVTMFSNCIVEMLSVGVAVQLNGIGTFYPTLKSRPGGAETKEEACALGPDNLVEGIHVRFLPDGTKLDNITSKKFKERCTLKFHMLKEFEDVDDGTGNMKRMYTYTPVRQKDVPEPDPEP